MVKFDSLDELYKSRKELDEHYENGIPQVLIDFFDYEERRLKNKEYYRNKHSQKYKYSQEERRNYISNKEDEFWENNETEIVKEDKRIKSPSVEKEKVSDPFWNETEVTTQAVVAECEKNMFMFAHRYFPHYLRLPSSGLHKFLYRTLSRNLGDMTKKREGMKWAVAAPRGGAKILTRP